MHFTINNLLNKRYFRFVIFLCYILPEAFRYNEILKIFNPIITVSKAIIFMLLLIQVLINSKFIKYPTMAIFFTEIIILLSTIYNKNSSSEYLTWINTFINIIGIFLLFDNEIRRGNVKLVIDLYKYIKFIVVLNLFLFFLFPEGLGISSTLNNWGTYTIQKIHFIGFKNNWLLWLLCYAMLSEFLNEKDYVKNRMLDIVIIVVSVLYSDSSTAIFSIFLFYTFLCARKINVIWKVVKKLTYINVIIISFALQIGIVWFRVQNKFSFVIEAVFNKTVTFTSRTLIWDQAIEKLVSSPLIGWGNGTNGKFLNIAGYDVPAHNLLLDIILQGGFLGFGFFVILLFAVGKNVNHIRNNTIKNICNITIFIIFVGGLMESYFSRNLFYLPFIISNYAYIFEKQDRNLEET